MIAIRKRLVRWLMPEIQRQELKRRRQTPVVTEGAIKTKKFRITEDDGA